MRLWVKAVASVQCVDQPGWPKLEMVSALWWAVAAAWATTVAPLALRGIARCVSELQRVEFLLPVAPHSAERTALRLVVLVCREN